MNPVVGTVDIGLVWQFASIFRNYDWFILLVSLRFFCVYSSAPLYLIARKDLSLSWHITNCERLECDE